MNIKKKFTQDEYSMFNEKLADISKLNKSTNEFYKKGINSRANSNLIKNIISQNNLSKHLESNYAKTGDWTSQLYNNNKYVKNINNALGMS